MKVAAIVNEIEPLECQKFGPRPSQDLFAVEYPMRIELGYRTANWE